MRREEDGVISLERLQEIFDTHFAFLREAGLRRGARRQERDSFGTAWAVWQDDSIKLEFYLDRGRLLCLAAGPRARRRDWLLPLVHLFAFLGDDAAAYETRKTHEGFSYGEPDVPALAAGLARHLPELRAVMASPERLAAAERFVRDRRRGPAKPPAG